MHRPKNKANILLNGHVILLNGLEHLILLEVPNSQNIVLKTGWHQNNWDAPYYLKDLRHITTGYSYMAMATAVAW